MLVSRTAVGPANGGGLIGPVIVGRLIGVEVAMGIEDIEMAGPEETTVEATGSVGLATSGHRSQAQSFGHACVRDRTEK